MLPLIEIYYEKLTSQKQQHQLIYIVHGSMVSYFHIYYCKYYVNLKIKIVCLCRRYILAVPNLMLVVGGPNGIIRNVNICHSPYYSIMVSIKPNEHMNKKYGNSEFLLHRSMKRQKKSIRFEIRLKVIIICTYEGFICFYSVSMPFANHHFLIQYPGCRSDYPIYAKSKVHPAQKTFIRRKNIQ